MEGLLSTGPTPSSLCKTFPSFSCSFLYFPIVYCQFSFPVFSRTFLVLPWYTSGTFPVFSSYFSKIFLVIFLYLPNTLPLYSCYFPGNFLILSVLSWYFCILFIGQEHLMATLVTFTIWARKSFGNSHTIYCLGQVHLVATPTNILNVQHLVKHDFSLVRYAPKSAQITAKLRLRQESMNFKILAGLGIPCCHSYNIYPMGKNTFSNSGKIYRMGKNTLATLVKCTVLAVQFQCLYLHRNAGRFV